MSDDVKTTTNHTSGSRDTLLGIAQAPDKIIRCSLLTVSLQQSSGGKQGATHQRADAAKCTARFAARIFSGGQGVFLLSLSQQDRALQGRDMSAIPAVDRSR